MTSGDGGNTWDAFDWDAWGQGDGQGEGGTAPGAANGHLRPDAGDEEEVPAGGQWVHQGGTLRWEEAEEGEPGQRGGGPAGGGLRTEAASQWADEHIALPLGAPPRLRLRAMRAWLARQQILAQEAQGVVLLERRREQEAAEEAGEDEATGGDPFAPLNLALAEQQAAAAEFEGMLEALAELENHAGMDRVLVEFYLLLGERIAALAQAAEATEDFRAMALVATPEEPPTQTTPPTPLTHAEWRGRAEAALAARRHAERVTSPEEEE
jgi:hypothetical protein